MIAAAYYNEIDKPTAAWLRELIKQDLIAPGDVDERSIVDVRASDLRPYNQCHFFAGIGGWSFALRLAGWPDDQHVWTGSCPCQPFSQAGKGKGTADPRHLWPEFARLIQDGKPAICFGEQVASADGRIWFTGVRADLEALGHAVGCADLCAAGIGAPHIRQRLYWLSVARCELRQTRGNYSQREETIGITETDQFERLCEVDGLGGSNNTKQRTDYRTVWQEGRNHACGDGSSPWLGNNNKRPQRRPVLSECPNKMSPWKTSMAWGQYDIVTAENGDKRRIECGTSPLAARIPSHVVECRGYGNSIVPQLACEFIKASVEAIEEIGGCCGN